MEKIVYGCNLLDEKIRKESSSGGVFTAFAECIINQSGVVFGVAMDNNCQEARMIKCSTIEELYKIRGSKYLQCKMENSFIEARRELNNGRFVLFSGTPCQINGLKLFLQKDYKNLICIDIICHGVPSPKLWKKYLNWMEDKKNITVKNVNFRSKAKSWHNFGMEYSSNKKKFFENRTDNPYMLMFLRDYSIRPSCYECKAKNYRLADISIGDFWGVEDSIPELNDDKGTSAVIIRTEKGTELFEQIADKIKYYKTDYETVIKKNSAEYQSIPMPEKRKDFFSDMNKYPFENLKRKYPGKNIKRFIKKLLKKL